MNSPPAATGCETASRIGVATSVTAVRVRSKTVGSALPISMMPAASRRSRANVERWALCRNGIDARISLPGLGFSILSATFLVNRWSRCGLTR